MDVPTHRRHQVGRELDAAEFYGESLSTPASPSSFRHAGPFNEHVASAENGRDDEVHHLLLAHEDRAHFFSYLLDAFVEGAQSSRLSNTFSSMMCFFLERCGHRSGLAIEFFPVVRQTRSVCRLKWFCSFECGR